VIRHQKIFFTATLVVAYLVLLGYRVPTSLLLQPFFIDLHNAMIQKSASLNTTLVPNQINQRMAAYMTKRESDFSHSVYWIGNQPRLTSTQKRL
jgi:hypothetical protein